MVFNMDQTKESVSKEVSDGNADKTNFNPLSKKINKILDTRLESDKVS